MTICRLCSQERKLVKSHIIPEAFWRRGRTGDGVPHLLTKAQGAFPKRAPVGVYGRFLCASCEGKFQEVDSYGAQVLIQDFESLFMPFVRDGVLRAFESTAVDQAQLLRFVVSVAWRASVSDHPFFKHVDLGAFLADAAKVVLHPELPVDSEQFSCVLTIRMPEVWSTEVANTMISPRKRDLEGATVFEAPFARAKALLRVGQPKMPDAAETLSLTAKDRLSIYVSDFRASRDLRDMIDIVHATDPKVMGGRESSRSEA